jgi:DtxR family Mn-dependent transcriptional regulator
LAVRADEKLKLSQSLEDYLETIYVIQQTESVARIKDIASRLDVSAPSVSGAVKSLRKMGLVEHSDYGYVELSEKGRKKAAQIYEIHEALTSFLHRILGLDAQKAEADACKIEHVLDTETARRISQFLEFSLQPLDRCEGCAVKFKKWRENRGKNTE